MLINFLWLSFKYITDLHSLCRFLYFNFATGWFPLTGGSDVTAGVDVGRSAVQLMRLLLGSVHRMLQLFIHSHFREDELTIYSTASPGCNTHKLITCNKCSERDQCQETDHALISFILTISMLLWLILRAE